MPRIWRIESTQRWWLVLGFGNYHPPATITNHQSPTTSHQSPTTNHQPPTTSHQPPTTSHQPPE